MIRKRRKLRAQWEQNERPSIPADPAVLFASLRGPGEQGGATPRIVARTIVVEVTHNRQDGDPGESATGKVRAR
jgi:hypothetical protein